MTEIAVRVLINAVALVAAVQLVPGAEFDGEWWQLGIVAAVFGLINAYLRPIAKLLSLPLNLVSFGLVGLLLNGGLMLLLALASGQLELGFTLAGWPSAPFDADVVVTAVLAALVVSIVSSVLAVVRLVTPKL